MTNSELRRRFSSNIKRYRKEKKLTQIQLAELAGVANDSIISIENQRLWPSDVAICKIANALNVEVYQLFLPTIDTIILENDSTGLRNNLYDKISQIINDTYNEYLKEISSK